MKPTVQACLLLASLMIVAREANAQWWVGGRSYSLRVDKYDSFYGEARSPRWSVERPPGVAWLHMHPPKRIIHATAYEASAGYPAVYRAAYPATFRPGPAGGDAGGYRNGYPLGYPVDAVMAEAHALTWHPKVVQVDPLPGDSKLSQPYPTAPALPAEPAIPMPAPAGN